MADAEESLDSIAITNMQEESEGGEAEGFNAQWQSVVAAGLQPTNLPLARVQRAWERKPLPPLSRRKVRVGKVWKRAIPTSRAVTADEVVQHGAKRRRARTSLQSPLKPVKKLCLGSDFGMGARVSQWEDRQQGSPARKIVTRSAMEDGELVALPEQQEEQGAQEDGDVTVEILDEDGNVLDARNEEHVEQDWEDEDDGEDKQEGVFDGTMMHLSDAIAHAAQYIEPANTATMEDRTTAEANKVDSPVGDVEPTVTGEAVPELQADGKPTVQERTDPAVSNAKISLPTPSQSSVVLPEGFVSPVKQRRKLGPRLLRSVSESRRKTLPVQFAPAVGGEPDVNQEQKAEDREGSVQQTQPSADEITLATKEDTAISVEPEEDAGVANDTDRNEMDEWEDIEEHEVTNESEDVKIEDAMDDDVLGAVPASDEPTQYDGNYVEEAKEHKPRLILGLELYDKLPSSPVPTIGGPHPRLPLRRSPRRKSSSPLKQSTSLSHSEMPHLVAFTPLKRFAPPFDMSHSQPETTPTQNNAETTASDNPSPSSPIQRASSAPPESPQLSPRKPAKPRISDDTALLQAFLNRAEERKNGRRMSVTDRENLTNRRDSDTIRHALASPGKPLDALVDLDPNSPSPRKASALAPTGTGEEDVEMADAAPTKQLDTAEPEKKTRSGRTRRKPQVLSQSAVFNAPAKITIRGSSSGGADVNVKKNEAQELTAITRNNTKKNKGASVLPPLRLTKLAAEKDEGSELAAVEKGAEDAKEDGVAVAPGRRGVKWAETLVSFQSSTETELSSLSDEQPEERMPWERGMDFDPTEPVAKPPPAAETPSKPKIRRLKAPKTTAASAGTSATAKSKKDAQEEVPAVPPPSAEDEKSKVKPAPKARRSRIATPAKGLSNSSLLPADIAPAAPAAPRTRRKMTSKLPPPGTIAAAPVPGLGAGKENQNQQSLISSPPKKRSAAAAAAAAGNVGGGGLPSLKNFAPKLDFSKAAVDLKPQQGDEKEALPGLKSPAKKGGRRAAIFGSSVGSGAASAKSEEPVVAGLASPAKKRTRRAGG